MLQGGKAPSRRSGLVKDFRCGPRRKGAAWCVVGPRWKSSQGGSRVVPGAVYGESVPRDVATAGSERRLAGTGRPRRLAGSVGSAVLGVGRSR